MKIDRTVVIKQKKILNIVKSLLEPSIRHIKKSRKRRNMPFKQIGAILKIFYPKTKYRKMSKGYFKHVFIVHSDKRKFALKIGRSKKHIRKDYTTYNRLPESIRTKYFAKIYWRHGLFMLQKYGRKVKVSDGELTKLKEIGKKYKLKDVKRANIMKIGNKLMLVDAERK